MGDEKVEIAVLENEFKNIANSFKELKKTTSSILIQTTKHNGRMTTIESSNKMLGNIIKVSVPVIIGAIAFAYQLISINVDQKIELSKQAVLTQARLEMKSVLNGYEFKIIK